MSVIAIAVIGITAVLLAVQFKGLKPEFGVYLSLAAALVIFFYGAGKLGTIIEAVRQIESYIHINSTYVSALIKIIGITYVAEFSSGICKDAGYGAIGSQIEIFGKLAILSVSMPIILALLETLDGFLR